LEWMILPLKRYAEFGGRSRRKEYWMFTVFNILLSIAALLIDRLAGFGIEDNGPVGIVVSLGLLVPGLAVWVRRLHDIDRSAWWVLLIFIPIIGWIALLVFACTEGTQGSNRFGEDPKNPLGDLGRVFS
jgi:uncharacterized membrane protein YhaH (DUF805 family)